jgi:hypothetical protein
MDCSGHVLMNNARDMCNLIMHSGEKMRFTATRQETERRLKRTALLKWTEEEKEAPSEEGEESEEEEEKKEAAEIKQANSRSWPWMFNRGDLATLRSMRANLKVWDAEGSGFRLPDNLFARTGQLKIHDWIVMTGGILSYMIMQCTGMQEDHKSLLIDFAYMLV